MKVRQGMQVAGLVGVMALGTIAPAYAADLYMGGVLGGTPGYNTMTGPTGQKCDSGFGGSCKRISYNNFSSADAEKKLAAELAKKGSVGNTIWVYSLSSTGAVDYLNKHPEDRNTWIIVGSPAKPGSAATIAEGNRVLTNTQTDITFVTKYGDSVAMRGTPGASPIIHTSGYRKLDASKPTTTRTLEGTNTKDNVYGAPKPKVTLASIIQGWKDKAAARREERAEARRVARAEKDAQEEAKAVADDDDTSTVSDDPEAAQDD